MKIAGIYNNSRNILGILGKRRLRRFTPPPLAPNSLFLAPSLLASGPLVASLVVSHLPVSGSFARDRARRARSTVSDRTKS